MPLMQLELPEEENKKVRLYQINHNLKTKKEAIVEMIKKFVDDDEKIGDANERKRV